MFIFSIQAGPKVIKIAVSQLQFSFGVGKDRTQCNDLNMKGPKLKIGLLAFFDLLKTILTFVFQKNCRAGLGLAAMPIIPDYNSKE